MHCPHTSSIVIFLQKVVAKTALISSLKREYKIVNVFMLTVIPSLFLMGCGNNITKSVQSNVIKVNDEIQLIETVRTNASVNDSDQIVIPYEKYQLKNGLTVILHEDKSDPLVHVDITYHVGSARENIGKSGFAHFFEHMQFQGSENVADEEHFKIVTEAGGTLNGSTNSDRTNYFQTIPANQLEKILWLESDRMGYFLDAVTQKKFEIQRETVKNERGQSYENRPYGLVYEKISQALYPEGHPYSWTTIGYVEDLNRVNVNDLKQFFLRWYGPNNATLTIGGDIDKQQTLDWVIRYFADIPQGPAVQDMKPQPVTLDSDRYLSYEDNINLPLLYFSFPTVYAQHPDEAPLDVLANILGGGESSILYKNLVKTSLAVNATASHPCRELACAFQMYAFPNPAHSSVLSSMQQIIIQSLKEFEQRGVNDDDLKRVKGSIISDMVYGLESVKGKVLQLAYYETFMDNPNHIQKDIERYSSVTKDDVIRVYKRYIKDNPKVILSVVPKGAADLIASTDTFIYQQRQFPDNQSAGSNDLELRVAKSRIDRSVKPKAGENPSLKVPKLWKATLKNGIEILGTTNTEVPTTALQIVLKVGQIDEPLQSSGLASLTAAMLNESTQQSSNEAISNRLQQMGSSFYINSDDFYSTVYIKSLTSNLTKTLNIMAEHLFMPKFDEREFIRVKAQIIQLIEVSKKEVSEMALKAMDLLLFGEDNSFAHPNAGSVKSVNAIGLDEVKAFYQRYYQADNASVIVVSNLPKEQVLKEVAFLEDWNGEYEVPKQKQPKPFPSLAKNTLYFIDKAGATQSAIRVFKPSLLFDATGEFHKNELMNYVLGEAFNSRINLNLREDKGYTYGARSNFVGNEYYGYYVAYSAVRTDVTLLALQEMIKELDNYQQQGPTIEEWLFTQNSIGQRDALKYETPSQKIGFLFDIYRFGLDRDYIEQQQQILAKMSKDDAVALAKKHLDTNSMAILIVGDKAKVLPELQPLDYKIVELDLDGV